MKTLIIISLFLFGSLLTNAQTVYLDSTTNKYTISEIVKVDSSLTKDKLYSNAREWLSIIAVDSKSIIQMDDRELGKIIFKSDMSVTSEFLFTDWDAGYVEYTFSLYFKDGRYKYVVTDFYHTGNEKFSSAGPFENEGPDGSGVTHSNWIDMRNSVYTRLESLILDLKKSMSKISDDNW